MHYRPQINLTFSLIHIYCPLTSSTIAIAMAPQRTGVTAGDQPLPSTTSGGGKTMKDRAARLRRKLVYNEMNPIADALLTLVILFFSPFIAFSAFMHDKLMFKFLNRTYIYNMSWEDPRMDHRVMKLGNNDHVITIASAGCNVLDYIIEGAP